MLFSEKFRCRWSWQISTLGWMVIIVQRSSKLSVKGLSIGYGYTYIKGWVERLRFSFKVPRVGQVSICSHLKAYMRGKEKGPDQHWFCNWYGSLIGIDNTWTYLRSISDSQYQQFLLQTIENNISYLQFRAVWKEQNYKLQFPQPDFEPRHSNLFYKFLVKSFLFCEKWIFSGK